MESVEELCEHIALIHRSKKVLDGKLSDIKKAYKNNIFKVGLQTDSADMILKELADKFDISSSSYDAAESQLDFTLQLPSSDSRNVLAYLSSKANVNRFVETIPSTSQIFIQTVQSKESHE